MFQIQIWFQIQSSCCGCMLTVVCFVAIGNAYAVLSNPEKRRHYDQHGEVKSCAGRRRHAEQDFQPDISPEDLFNMFFGGGFPSSECLCVCLFALLHCTAPLHTFLCTTPACFQTWFFFFISPQRHPICIEHKKKPSSDLNIGILVSD